ncbi:unnamed protein product [Moneuplotes crassus]|uniref:F-box domain-containing protein n=1 Tax=Euplotes crassus TaxID=5936 RepID=A0AAD1XZ98_EUPCR|nr:unnamed protein product [Moneuplotes crassus]
MKFLNIVLREILIYLEFEDIQKSKLHLVNKQFYHNIIEDNELLRRMLLQKITLVMDYDKEEQYHREVILNNKNEQAEESKIEELTAVKFYEDPRTSLIPLLLELQKEQERLLLVFQRTSGGHYKDYDKVENVFLDNEEMEIQYYSAPQVFFPNGLCCLTGIVYGTESKELKYWLRAVDIIEPNCKIKLKSLIDSAIKQSDSSFGINIINILTKTERAIKSVLENNLNKLSIYENGKYIQHDKQDKKANHTKKLKERNQTYQYDTSCYDNLIRQNLFLIKEIKVMGKIISSCPIKAIALFVHDFPTIPENHPLVLLTQKVYDLSESLWSISRSSTSFREALYYKHFIKCFSELSESGLIPKISSNAYNWMEFDQKFYFKKFDSKQNCEEEKLDFSKADLNQEDTSNIEEMYQQLEETDYYRIRLAAIGYGFDTKIKEYNYEFNQMIAGRFITVLALDATTDDDYFSQVNIGGIFFKGKIIPSILNFTE